jgi:hypothetical protein
MNLSVMDFQILLRNSCSLLLIISKLKLQYIITKCGGAAAIFDTRIRIYLVRTSAETSPMSTEVFYGTP